MKLLLCCACLFLALSSCEKDADPTPGVSIRVRNGSPSPFANVVVDTSGGENNYGSLGPGQTSDYFRFSTAYSYASVQVTVNGQNVSFQPFDYVGEKPLTPGGRFTYVVDVVGAPNGTPQRLSIKLENS